MLDRLEQVVLVSIPAVSFRHDVAHVEDLDVTLARLVGAIGRLRRRAVDDELPVAEQALLIRQLCADPGLQRMLARYQLLSDTLHDNLPDRVDISFQQRVYAALQQEAPIQAAPPAATRWYRPMAGLAIAASVAIVAVVSLQNTRQDSTADMQVMASSPTIDNYIRAENVPAPAAPSARARGLDVYLVNHNEYAVNRGVQGMLPYVRIVGQDPQPGGGNTE